MNRLVGVLSTALLFTAVVATHLWLQHRDDREQLAALQARISAVQARPAPMLPSAVQRRAAAGVETANSPPFTSLTAAQLDELRPRTDAVMKKLNGPEDRDIRRAQRQMQLSLDYPDLAAELHLSAEEANRLLELIATQQVDMMDTSLTVHDSGNLNSVTAQEALRKAEALRQARNGQLAALLGSKYPQWQEYEKTAPSRKQVKELQAVLGSGPNALQPAEAKSLVMALSTERGHMEREQRDALAAGVNAREVLQRRSSAEGQRLLDTASAQLTPLQQDRFRRMLVRQNLLTSQQP